MAANMNEMGDYQTMPTLETFGFLPKLTQDEVYDQINYVIAQGWSPAIEHEHPSRAMSYYWTMWKLPFFGEQKLGRVVEELEACRRSLSRSSRSPDRLRQLHPKSGHGIRGIRGSLRRGESVLPETDRAIHLNSEHKYCSTGLRYMAQMANTHSGDARKVAVARRRAQSQTGKATTVATASTVCKQPSKPATPVVSANQGGARAASRARRQAMSTSGKAAITSQDRTRVVTSYATAVKIDTQQSKRDCGCGCKGDRDKRESRSCEWRSNDATRAAGAKLKLAGSTARAASLARRQAMSTRGKAGLNGKGMSTAPAPAPPIPMCPAANWRRPCANSAAATARREKRRASPAAVRDPISKSRHGGAGCPLESRRQRNQSRPNRHRHHGRAQ